MHIRTLSNNECTAVFAANRIGFLACAKGGQPYVVPIHYAYEARCVYGFSMPGRKIDWMRANPLVSMLVDERGEGRRWKCAIAEGRFEELSDQTGHSAARYHAWSLLSKHFDWWEPGGLKPEELPLSNHSPHIFFRVLVDRLSGREGSE